jgi:hypothetical protein
MKNTPKITTIPGKIPETHWDMNNPNKVFGVHEKRFLSLLINRKFSEKNENKFQKNPENSRKS